MNLRENCRDKLPFIDIKDVFFSYQKGEYVLKDVNTSFYRAEFTAVTGPNGSGKTTLGKLLTGILTPDSGKILINSENTEDISLGSIGKRIGYLFQEPERQLFTPTVREEIGFVEDFMGRTSPKTEQKVKNMIETFSLGGLEFSSPYRISRGEKQRVALASILINEPSFLVLDEPTTGLHFEDIKKLLEVLHRLREGGNTVIVIEHNLDVIKSADYIVDLGPEGGHKGGEVIATGTPEEVAEIEDSFTGKFLQEVL
ncbi:MAG: energy-coupling factor ABC transporter ATP-binding protein [Halanaerobiaceae bacterium]